jgi:hypothetical protein
MEDDFDIVKCNSFAEYCQEAGVLRVSGATGGQVYRCVKQADCQINITGIALGNLDHVQMISQGFPCGASPEVAAPGNFSISRPGATADATVWPTSRLFDVGISWLQGRYVVCYCANYDQSARTNVYDAILGQTPCDADAEFTHIAGTLIVRGTLSAEHYECVKNTTCLPDISGYALSEFDSAQAIVYDINAGQTSVADTCTSGSPAVDPAFAASRTNQSEGTGGLRTFDFGNANLVATYTVCYCTHHSDDVQGLLPTDGFCDEDIEFTHQAGTLVVRGAVGLEDYRCHRGTPCPILISGNAMRATDFVQIVPHSFGECGGQPKVKGFLLNPAGSASEGGIGSHRRRVEVYGSTDRIFDAGLVSTQGTFTVCYCASYDAEDEQTVVCSSDGEFTHEAGTIVVRGAVAAQMFQCVKDIDCYTTIDGWAMTGADFTQMAASPGLCGVSSYSTDFVPNRQQTFGGNDTVRTFVAMAYLEAKYLVCYCADFDANVGVNPTSATVCSDNVEYSHQAGTLTVRGPVGLEDYTCYTGIACTLGPFHGQALAYGDKIAFILRQIYSSTALTVIAQDYKGNCQLRERDNETGLELTNYNGLTLDGHGDSLFFHRPEPI